MSTEKEEWWDYDTSWGADKIEPDKLAENLRKKVENRKDFVEEMDCTRRHCKVRIIAQDTEDKIVSQMAQMTASKSLQHWAVVCKFKGRNPFKFELENTAGGLVGGIIIPSQTELKSLEDVLSPPDSVDVEMVDRHIEMAEIGSIVMSPRKVWELVYTHEMNLQSYNAGGYNCQDWALKLLKAMSLNQTPDPRSCSDLVKAAKQANFKPVSEWPLGFLVKGSALSVGLSKHYSPSKTPPRPMKDMSTQTDDIQIDDFQIDDIQIDDIQIDETRPE